MTVLGRVNLAFSGRVNYVCVPVLWLRLLAGLIVPLDCTFDLQAAT